MSRRIRVLEMIDEATLGGGQVHIALLAKHLPRDEFEVTVAAEGRGYLVDEMKQLEIRCRQIEIANRFSLRSFRQVRDVVAAERFDILHTHGGTAGIWGRLVAAATGFPNVRIHTYHGLHYLSKGHQSRVLFSIADRMALPFTTKTICVCYADLRKGIAHQVVAEQKAVVIYNGVEVERFKPSFERERLRRELAVAESDVVLGTIGRLHTQKGQDVLVRAFQMVAKRFRNVRLWVIGEGELRKPLERLAGNLGVRERVNFLGARSDIPELLSAIDIFVLPSMWEGHPIALLEAMAAGKPVVASNVDGIPEVVEHEKSALLVPPGDDVELASAIRRLVEDPELREQLAARAAERVNSIFTANQMVEKVAELYRRCVCEADLRRGPRTEKLSNSQ